MKFSPATLALVNGMTEAKASYAETIELDISGKDSCGSVIHQRLGRTDINSIKFAIVDARLFLFESGMGCLVIELRYSAVASDSDLLPTVILEANHQLAHPGISKSRPLHYKRRGEEALQSFSFNALCRIGSQACEDHVGNASKRNRIQDYSLNGIQPPKINQTKYPADDCEQDGLMEK